MANTSLFNYLMMHEGILGLFPQSRGRKSSDYFFKNITPGERQYRSHFHTQGYRDRLASKLGYETRRSGKPRRTTCGTRESLPPPTGSTLT